jgi:hypothetical protein
MPRAGCKPVITASERSKTVHASDRLLVVTSEYFNRRKSRWICDSDLSSEDLFAPNPRFIDRNQSRAHQTENE